MLIATLARRAAEMVTLTAMLTATIAAGQAGTEAEAEELFRRALAATENGDLVTARLAAVRGVELAPDHAGGLEILGTIEELGGAIDAARAAYERAIVAAPDRASAQLRLGMLWVRLGNSDAAVTPLRNAIRLEPDNPRAHAYLGAALRQLNDPTGAKIAFESAWALQPNDGRLAMDVALSRRGDGDLPGAVEAAVVAAAALPDEPAAHLLLGELLLDRPDSAALFRAPASFRRAIALQPHNVGHYAALAEAYDEVGLPEEAERALRDPLALDGSQPSLHFNLAVTLIRQQRYREALDAADKSLRLAATDGWAHYYRGRALRQLGRGDESREALVRAAQLLPEQVMPLTEAARALTEAGRFDDAEGLLFEAVGRGIRTPDMALEFGRLLLAQGNPVEAIAPLQRVVESSANLIEAHYLLGTALVRSGRTAEGRRALETYRALNATSEQTRTASLESGIERRDEVYLLRARVFDAEGRFDEALLNVQQAADLAPSRKEIWEVLARVHDARGDTEAAERARLWLAELEEQ